MTDTLSQIIDYESESHKLDFKSVQYDLGKNPKKDELLKDIMAFANHISDEDKYIIVGIKETESSQKEIIPIKDPVDEAKYRQYIAENIEPEINFEYKISVYQGKTISYFKISDNKDRPYLLKKDTINYKYGDGFIRYGTAIKKIGRKELNDIEQKKKNYINRKQDLVILERTENYFEEDQLISFKHLDIDIENKSNKSIRFHIEMILKKNNSCVITTTPDLEEKLNQINEVEDMRGAPPIFDIDDFKAPLFTSLQVGIKDEDSEMKIWNRKEISLPQNQSSHLIFGKSLVAFGNAGQEIYGQIILRSDEFVDGALLKELKFKI